MKQTTTLTQPTSRLLVGGLVAACVAQAATAADMGGFSIHGSLSTTASYSPEYNYLGDTKDSLDLNQNELTLNATRRFDNGLKLAAQLYAYELAAYEDMTVDFANLDYSFKPEIGVRVGRNKLPVGFYNEVQDLDQVRIFASLPLNFYPRASRPFGASYDGASVYGNIGAGKAGSFDYQGYYGVIQPLDEDMPFVRGIGASAIEIKEMFGGSLVWNTPVEGLRLGYTLQLAPDIPMTTGPVDIDVEYRAQVASIEYTRGKWIFATEYKNTHSRSQVTTFPLPATTSGEDHVYFQVTYQATDKLGVGAYYAYSDYESTGVDKDLAFASSYAVKPWWLVKAEVHFMDGINQLGAAGDLNPGASDDTWTYFVLKSTLSF